MSWARLAWGLLVSLLVILVVVGAFEKLGDRDHKILFAALGLIYVAHRSTAIGLGAMYLSFRAEVLQKLNHIERHVYPATERQTFDTEEALSWKRLLPAWITLTAIAVICVVHLVTA